MTCRHVFAAIVASVVATPGVKTPNVGGAAGAAASAVGRASLRHVKLPSCDTMIALLPARLRRSRA